MAGSSFSAVNRLVVPKQHPHHLFSLLDVSLLTSKWGRFMQPTFWLPRPCIYVWGNSEIMTLNTVADMRLGQLCEDCWSFWVHGSVCGTRFISSITETRSCWCATKTKNKKIKKSSIQIINSDWFMYFIVEKDVILCPNYKLYSNIRSPTVCNRIKN